MKQTILIIVAITLLSLAGYLVYNRAPSPQPALTSSIPDELEVRLQELEKIKNLKLDTSVLQDPLLLSLQNRGEATSTAALPGRENPFLPIAP